MSKEQVLDIVEEALGNIGCPMGEVDSLGALELIMTIEDLLDVSLSINGLEDVTTEEELVFFVTKQITGA